MQRFSSYGLFLLILMLVVVMPGCGGGGDDASSKPDNTVATVDVSPSSLSMEFGQVVGLSAVAKNAGGTVLLQTFTYKSDNTALVTVSTSGNVCAGTWDAAFIVCTPGTTAGATTVTVTAGTISKTVTVNVHRKVASVSITSTGVPCTSSTKTQQFTARAFASDGTDITSTVGAATWASSNLDIATLDAAGLATAKKPGSTTISALINNVLSLPITMVTCPPASITIQEKDSNPAVTSFTLDAAATKTLAATVIDTLGNPITDITLTWSSSQSSVATVSPAGVLVAGASAGRASIIASCTPPSCNPGTNTPVYSNLVRVTVNGTTATTVYATGKNATTIVPIDTATNVAGTAIPIPTVTVNNVATNPVLNSFLFNPLGTLGYIGTDQGLLVLNPSTNTVANTASLAGTVLAISPDSSRVLIATATTVLALDATTGNSSTLAIPNATSAAFTPDGLKAYIVSGGTTIYVYSLALGVTSFGVSSAVNGVTVLKQGNYTYLAGDVGSTIATRATCNNASLTALATAQKPVLIDTTYDGTHVYATEGANMYDVSVTATTAPCPPPAPAQALTTTSYGVAVTPKQLIVLPDGTKAYLTNSSAQVLVYTPGTGVSTLNLAAGSTASTTGGTTLDGKSLYVGALGTNDVQKFDTASGVVIQIPVNLKDKNNTATSPDLVAVRAK